ncbi:hypothetical protein GOODEAATRI_029364, partial [Goodea atripinnis]
SEGLKQLSALDTIGRTVAKLKCTLERYMNNGSVSIGCCPLGWESFSTSCYFFSRTALSWHEARDWCNGHESHLVILMGDEEWVRHSDFVTRHSAGTFYWVGLTDEKSGRWEWVNQTPYVMNRRKTMERLSSTCFHQVKSYFLFEETFREEPMQDFQIYLQETSSQFRKHREANRRFDRSVNTAGNRSRTYHENIISRSKPLEALGSSRRSEQMSGAAVGFNMFREPLPQWFWYDFNTEMLEQNTQNLQIRVYYKPDRVNRNGSGL